MANIDLLTHELDRFGVVTVMDVTIFDKVKGNPVLFLDTLKISNITAEGQMKEIRGGKYADLLITYDFARSLNLEFQDALLSPASMRQLWGAIRKDVVTAHGYEIVKLTGGTATIEKEGATVIGVMNLESGAVYTLAADPLDVQEDEYTVADEVITIEDYDAVADDRIRVDYTYLTAEEMASELVLTSESFPKTVKLVGRTFVINQQTGQKVELEIEVPKLKLATNFTMTLDAEGDASVFDFSGMALIDGPDKELLKVKTLGYTDM